MGDVPAAGRKDPIARIEWVDAATLHANGWNPNRVFKKEFELLELSLLSLGWIQPVLASTGGQIIDGFHRWRLSQDSSAVYGRYGGMLPVARLDVDEPTAMAITVRINRAKGTHTAVKMSELVHIIVNEHGWAKERLAQEIGAHLNEIELLLQDNIFTKRKVSQWGLSEAWYPTPNGTAKKPEPTFGGYGPNGGDGTVTTVDQAIKEGVLSDDE